MTAVEIKKEINKALDQVPEKLLVDILDLIESALARPFATFNDEDLYPTPIEKASAILES